MLNTCNQVFVYGTLKNGHGNNRILSTASYIGDASTSNKFALGDAGVPYAFPLDVVKEKDLIEHLCHPIRGELYRINDIDTAIDLDSLEGYPDYYNRRLIQVEVGHSPDTTLYHAWIYTIEDWEYASWCAASNYNLETGEWSWE